MKKLNKKDVVIFILIGIAGALLIINIIHICYRAYVENKSDVIYRPTSTAEDEFYPGRAYGDYSDSTFCFDNYLESIGASKVQRYMYTNNEGKVCELWFEFDGLDYKIITTEFRTDTYNYGLYSKLQVEIEHGQCTIAVPTENTGSYICDATSPFKVDRIIFDVFHAATDKNSELAKELRAGLDETNCPFYGLGIAHYERWEDGTIIWHDDMGEFTFADGLDLHY